MKLKIAGGILAAMILVILAVPPILGRIAENQLQELIVREPALGAFMTLDRYEAGWFSSRAEVTFYGSATLANLLLKEEHHLEDGVIPWTVVFDVRHGPFIFDDGFELALTKTRLSIPLPDVDPAHLAESIEQAPVFDMAWTLGLLGGSVLEADLSGLSVTGERNGFSYAIDWSGYASELKFDRDGRHAEIFADYGSLSLRLDHPDLQAVYSFDSMTMNGAAEYLNPLLGLGSSDFVIADESFTLEASEIPDIDYRIPLWDVRAVFARQDANPDLATMTFTDSAENIELRIGDSYESDSDSARMRFSAGNLDLEVLETWTDLYFESLRTSDTYDMNAGTAEGEINFTPFPGLGEGREEEFKEMARTFLAARPWMAMPELRYSTGLGDILLTLEFRIKDTFNPDVDDLDITEYLYMTNVTSVSKPLADLMLNAFLEQQYGEMYTELPADEQQQFIDQTAANFIAQGMLAQTEGAYVMAMRIEDGLIYLNDQPLSRLEDAITISESQ